MCKKLALIFCLCTVFLIGNLVFLFSGTVDFPTVFHCLKLVVPAGFVSYFGGYYLGRILQSAKAETTLIATANQKQFVDDLLLEPDQVLNVIPIKRNKPIEDNTEAKKE